MTNQVKHCSGNNQQTWAQWGLKGKGAGPSLSAGEALKEEAWFTKHPYESTKAKNIQIYKHTPTPAGRVRPYTPWKPADLSLSFRLFHFTWEEGSLQGMLGVQGPWMFWLCRSLCSSLNCATVWSFTSGFEICSRMLSVDQLSSPENISVRILATTGITCGQENHWWNVHRCVPGCHSCSLCVHVPTQWNNKEVKTRLKMHRDWTDVHIWRVKWYSIFH